MKSNRSSIRSSVIAEAPIPDSAEPMAVQLDFLGGGSIQLSGIYKKQQTSHDIHIIRYYMQADGYGYKITDVLENYIIGPGGIEVDFGDEAINELWKDWSWDPENPDEGFDATLRFMLMSLIRDGESFYQIVGDNQNFYVTPIDPLDLPLNTQFQTLSGNRSGIGHVTAAQSGIDRDSMRRPLRYNFKPYIGMPYTLTVDEVVHTYVRRYAGQERGLSWFLGAIDDMRDLHDFEANVAQAVKNAASDPGHYEIPEHYYPQIKPGDVDSETKALETLRSTMHRAPDKKGVLPRDVKWHPADISNVYQGSVVESQRRAGISRVGAHLGLSYHIVSGDASSANFSAIQQGNLDNRAMFRKAQRKILASTKKIVRRWLMWQALKSSRMETKIRKLKPRYLLPPMEYIDRSKAAMADKTLYGIGGTDLSTIIRANGQDPDAVFQRQAEDEYKRRKYYDMYGLEFPDDKRQNDSDLTNNQDSDNIDNDKDNEGDQDDDKKEGKEE